MNIQWSTILFAPSLRPSTSILAGLFFIMLFTLLKKIVNVMKSSSLHCPVSLMVSITITSKIIPLLNLSEIRGPNIFSCVANFLVDGKIGHIFEKKTATI